MHNSKRDQLLGAVIVGTMSTTIMTLVMEGLYKRLPRQQRYALPPEEITRVAEVAFLGKHLGRTKHLALTLISHYGYGIILSIIYRLISDKLPFKPLSKGIGYGIVVWAASYFGWLPALRVLPPPTKWPPARRFLMLVAHLVWGAVLGILTSAFHK